MPTDSSQSNTGSTQSALLPEHKQPVLTQSVGILLADSANQRLIENIATTLDLSPVLLDPARVDAIVLADFELIIADEPRARELHPRIQEEQRTRQQIKPALLAVVPAPASNVAQPEEGKLYDAILAMPESAHLLTAQISVALYAHRAFTVRYQSSIEELNLNRNIFRSVTSGISIANAQLPDMPLLYVNPAFEAMTGYTLEEVIGANCRFLQGSEHDQPGVVLIREAIAQQRETIAVLRNFRKDGTPFWNELSLSPIRNRDGVLTHFVGIQMDVTERVALELALLDAEKLAAVGRLASVISHEINNPLEAITNLVYLIGETLPETCDIPEAAAECRGYIQQADQELRRMKLITSQSLRFSKQSHGPEAITAEDLLDTTLEIYASRFSNFRVNVERRFRSSQHIVCLASEIRQVLTNLITNAADAMREHGGRLLIRTREATDWPTGRHGVLVTIADTGTGMSPDIQRNIYRAFYTTKGANGTGLGLWVSLEIVQRHHGNLRLRTSQAADRHGTVFQLFLPFQAASGGDQASTERDQTATQDEAGTKQDISGALSLRT